jgi:hypothetical protein
MCWDFFFVFSKLGKFQNFQKKWEYHKFFFFFKKIQEFSPNKNIVSYRLESYFPGQSLAKKLPKIKTLQARTFAQLVLGP